MEISLTVYNVRNNIYNTQLSLTCMLNGAYVVKVKVTQWYVSCSHHGTWHTESFP